MADLSDLIAGYHRDLVKVMRTSSVTLTEDVVIDTPLKDGTANSSWNPNRGEPVPGNDQRTDGARYPQRAKVEAVANSLQPGDVFSVANGAGHIRKLEYGYSAQAPNGMLRRNLARWQSFVDGAVRGV